MIAASEPQEFIPFGRQQIHRHPGAVVVASRPPEATLLQKLSQVNIDDQSDNEWWMLRGSKDVEEEELYISGKTAVWSQGMAGRSLANTTTEHSAARVLKTCYTMETPVKQALWCKFIKNDQNATIEMPSICIIDDTKIKAYTTDGEDFLSALQFKVSAAWATKFGLLLERVTAVKLDKKFNPIDLITAPQLPTLFSLLHPLDEVAPVLIMKHGDSLSFMSDPYLKVVFTSEEPSILLFYDVRSGKHSVWKVRRATADESQMMSGKQDNVTTQSNFSMQSPVPCSTSSNFTQRVSLPNRTSLPGAVQSPFGSRSNSILGSSAPTGSPVVSQNISPLNSFKLVNQTPHNIITSSTTPSSWGSFGRSRNLMSPATPSALDARLGTSQQSVIDGENEPKPIVPELCLDYLWSENQTLSCFYEGEASAASRVFLSCDILHQKFLCYVVPSRNKLICVKISWTNQRFPEVILGSVSSLPAKDAAYLPSLKMTAILEPSGGVLLYTGIMLIGKLHVAGVNIALASSSYLSSATLGFVQNSHFPKRSSLMSSTVIGDPVFDDQVHLLSPVPSTAADVFDSSIGTGTGTGTVIHSTPRDAYLQSLRDPVANRLTLEFLNGSMFRISLPEVCSSPLVSKCLKVLKNILPREAALQTIVKWCGARNAPGTQDFSPAQEWQLFVSILLGLLGYDVEKLSVLQQNSGTIPDTPTQILKKKRAADYGSHDDWEYLLNSRHHKIVSRDLCSLLGLKRAHLANNDLPSNGDVCGKINTSAPLFSAIYLILFSFHLLYEELKLHTLLNDCLPMLAQFLHQLAVDLKLNYYIHHYWSDFPSKCPLSPSVESQISEENLKQLVMPTFLSEIPPNIMLQVYQLMKKHPKIQRYPVINKLNPRTKDIIQLIGLLCCGVEKLDKLVINVVPPGSKTSDSTPQKFSKAYRYKQIEKVVYMLSEMGYSRRELSTFPAGVTLMLYDAIHRVRENPPVDWSEAVFRLIGRQDLAATPPPPVVGERGNVSPPPPTVSRSNQENDDGMESMDREILKLRFSEDHRFSEVRNLLQSSQPVTIAITQRPDVSDHEFIEEQEKHLYAICTRTMALPLGRGMLTLRTSCPVASEPLPVPRLCLSGRAPPRGTTVDLSHIEVVPNMNLWPLFHNGVAAGLRISPNASNIDSTWIVYNKPKGGPEVLPEHAGFLMALGLNGHLGNLAELNTFKYLTRCHEMTSVGLLLGIAANKRGSMDVRTTKILSVHIESLLPPTSIELDIVQNIQVAALLGIGLVYQQTAHRHIAEVLLSEIGRPPGPEMENSVDRESYALAAGLGLGLVVLGTGSGSTGLTDLGIPDTLYYYMVGGHKRPLTGSQKEKYKSPSYQIREGDQVNTAVTAPGATLALGMMFFRSGNKAVANWMKAPDTQYLLDFVCPDLLLLRMIARGLILWDDILPTEEWVLDHVPPAIRPYCLVKPHPGNLPDNIDYETMNQAYCNIIAGACMAMGLRFAGSANNEAFTTLFNFCKKFTSMSGKSIAELAGKSTIETCLNVILLALAMVMAGTGELEVLRICRYLRSRVGQATNSVVTYGSHLATHMALGLLFLGGGRYTLSTSPTAVAAMLCAFFPKFPTHSNDNRYHLQAFRHLYVLASEQRLLLPRDIDSGSLCYAHLTFVYLDTPYYQNQTVSLKAPCILPELHLLKEVRVEDKRYWNIVFKRNQNWSQLENILNGSGCLGVKQRAGCLSYLEDPHGFRSLLAQTLTSDKAVSWSVPAESIFAFSSEPCTVNFAHFFLEQNEKSISSASTNELQILQFLTKLVFECVTHDKLSMLSIWLKMLQALQSLVQCPEGAHQLVWQLKLLIAHGLSYDPSEADDSYIPLLSPDLALALLQKVNSIIDSWENDVSELVCSYLKTGKIEDSVDNVAKLSMYTTFYDIPLPQKLMELLLDSSDPLSLYIKLQESHLPPSTVMKIFSLYKYCVTM
ncbi:anaphase promoting complex subunit 1 isoform X2 [Lycorma delicatula]|uniref:anaphase promoting complex subunit 1 isoform X2 n=1 Tax=Lycorma delicatula TaxID=130591 RepID=UPI003F510358